MVEKHSSHVREMFASIAHRYDLLNQLLSLRVDRRWRRVTRKKLAEQLQPGSRVLDLCTGTGDLALETARLGSTLGCDFCRPMLERGLRKLQRRPPHHPVWLVEADALQLPLGSMSFDVVTIAFGLRNLEDRGWGLQEMFRVLKLGGRLAILEFSVPTMPVFRGLYLFYFTKILPRVGALISGREGPYSYLPESVGQFAQPEELASSLRQIGFKAVTSYTLTGGIATLTMAEK